MISRIRLALCFLRGQLGRLVLTIIALACGVALVFAIDVVNRAVLQAFVQVIDAMAGRAALQVSAGPDGLFAEDVARRVAAVDGVELAVPVVAATAFTADDEGELLTVHGIDITDDDAIRVYEPSDDRTGIDDTLVFLSQPDSVVVTRTFAARRGLRVNDALAVDTPTGRRVLVVRGVIEPEGIGRIQGGNLLIMDLLAAQQMFTRPGIVNRVDVVVRREREVAEVRRRIAGMLPAGLDVAPPVQRKVDLHRVMRSVQVLLEAVALLALVAAFLVVFNRLSAVFEGRLWQLGVMRAMGARPRAVWAELVGESVLLGLLGVAVGVPAGFLLARAMLPIIATATALGAKLAIPAAQLHLQWTSVALATTLGVGATFLAAAIAGRRAVGVPPLAVLRYRGVELRSSRPWQSRGILVTTWAAAVTAALGQIYTRAAPWGLAATFFAVVGVALTARPLAELLGTPVASRVAGRLTPTLRLALASLARRPRRSALTAATLGVGVGVVVWMWILVGSFEQSLVAVMPGIFRADLVVGSARTAGGYVEAPIDDRVVDEIARLPNVARVVGHHAADWRWADGPIALNLFDARYFADAAFARPPLVGAHRDDAWPAVARGEAVVISTNFAHNLRTRVGDPIDLLTPSGPLTLPVAGMIHDFLSPRGTIVMARELYARRWHDTRITHALVNAAPGTDVAVLRADIARTLGRTYALRVLTVHELVDWFTAQVRRAFAAVYALAAMVLVVVALGVADTVAATVHDRRHELAAMGALGVRRGQVTRTVLAEAFLLGLFGVALAAVLGLSLGTFWVEATFPDLIGWTLLLDVPATSIAATAVAGVAVCVAAGLLPARHYAFAAGGGAALRVAASQSHPSATSSASSQVTPGPKAIRTPRAPGGTGPSRLSTKKTLADDRLPCASNVRHEASSAPPGRSSAPSTASRIRGPPGWTAQNPTSSRASPRRPRKARTVPPSCERTTAGSRGDRIRSKPVAATCIPSASAVPGHTTLAASTSRGPPAPPGPPTTAAAAPSPNRSAPITSARDGASTWMQSEHVSAATTRTSPPSAASARASASPATPPEQPSWLSGTRRTAGLSPSAAIRCTSSDGMLRPVHETTTSVRIAAAATPERASAACPAAVASGTACTAYAACRSATDIPTSDGAGTTVYRRRTRDAARTPCQRARSGSATRRPRSRPVSAASSTCSGTAVATPRIEATIRPDDTACPVSRPAGPPPWLRVMDAGQPRGAPAGLRSRAASIRDR